MRRAWMGLAAAALLAGCELGPKETVNLGFRGTGMEQVTDPDRLARAVAATQLPPNVPPLPPGVGGAAPGQWQNVQVLGDLSPGEFNRTMVAMTQWVSPKEGCGYCHVGANFASDSLYTKVVSRQMLRMTRAVNGQWTSHVGQTGVTCWTCHRGNPVPQNVWFLDRADQPLRHYLDRQDARVQSAHWAPSNDNRTSIKQTEYTYALMISMSRSLGVNCSYCHNSPRWSSWEQSTPQRLTALRGIRMTRSLNNDYLLPLQPVFPAERLGPQGDVAKVQCSTCHQGAYKPLYGLQTARQYPSLYPGGNPAASPAPASTTRGGGTGIPADSMVQRAGPTAPGAPTLPVPGPAPSPTSGPAIRPGSTPQTP